MAIDTKSWREQTIEGTGLGKVNNVYFTDTKPNYILLTNTCDSPLYISTSPRVSNVDADMILPPYGRQLFSQVHGVKELFIICYDSDPHSVRIKSWEGDFDPATINQTQETVPQTDNQNLGNVTVVNFPSLQDVEVTNPVTTVGVNNFPANQNVTVQNPVTDVTVLNPYTPLVVKDSYASTGNSTKNYVDPMKEIWLKNDGASDLTLVINTLSFTVKSGEVIEERFTSFTDLTITATEGYRVKVRG